MPDEPKPDYRAQRNVVLDLLRAAEIENEMLQEQHRADQRKLADLLKRLPHFQERT